MTEDPFIITNYWDCGAYSKQQVQGFIHGCANELKNFWKLPSPPSQLIIIIGEHGEGKTWTEHYFVEHYHNSWGLRCAVFDMTKELEIYLKNRDLEWFYPVKTVDEIENDSIFMADELDYSFNAKRAKSGENIDAEEFLTSVRQKGIPVIGCTHRIKGAIAAIRDQAQTLVWKRLAIGAAKLQTTPNTFLKEYGWKIGNLGLDEAIILSKSRSLDLSKYGDVGFVNHIPQCSYWSDKDLGSQWRNQKSRGFTFRENLDSITDRVYNEFKYKPRNFVIRQAIGGWIEREYPNRTWRPTEINAIIRRLCLRYVMDGSEDKEEKEKPLKITDADKYTDEGWEENIMPYLPEFHSLFYDDLFILPPRLTEDGDKSDYPDAIGILNKNEKLGVEGGEIGIVNGKYWAWVGNSTIQTHEKMKSEVEWAKLLPRLGFDEDIFLILFLQHKLNGKAFFIKAIPARKATRGSYTIQFPKPTDGVIYEDS